VLDRLRETLGSLAPGFTDPAQHRLADTILGAAIAILAGYLIFPNRARGEQEDPA
jgi:uncharacterized membrane protein YccC